jgi:transcriptional regulator GlxA family with amidase domain
LQEKRLSQAAFLLKNTELSVEEIALAVGYENKSYFHRIFTARYGTSPKKYRTNETELKKNDKL